MSLSVDAIRREMDEHRDKVVRLQQSEGNLRERIEQLEDHLARAQAELASTQGQIGHEKQVVEALQNAATLLAERLPGPLAAPKIAPAPAPAPEPGPKPESPQKPELGQKRHKLDPLTVDKRRPERRRKPTGPVTRRTIPEMAAELDLSGLSETVRVRAELVRDILAEYGPQRNIAIAEHLTELLDCGLTTARPIVSESLAVLLRQGRIRQHDASAHPRYAEWEVTPAERASGGLGTDLTNYEGTTTRWPRRGEGGRIVIESSAFESKR